MFNAYGVGTDCPEAIKVGVCGADQSCHESEDPPAVSRYEISHAKTDELPVEACELLAVKADGLDLEKGDEWIVMG